MRTCGGDAGDAGDGENDDDDDDDDGTCLYETNVLANGVYDREERRLCGDVDADTEVGLLLLDDGQQSSCGGVGVQLGTLRVRQRTHSGWGSRMCTGGIT